MKQKIIFFSIALFTITFFSCETSPIDNGPETSTSDSVIPVEDYCQGILDWVENTYPSGNVSIDSVLLITNPNGVQDMFEVHLSNGVVALFSNPGCQFISINCNCPTDYEPVCWNEITYDNQCFAECDGADSIDIVEGMCDECDCSEEPFDPVCWNDITYNNECEAICAGASPNSIIIDGACDDCNCTGEPYDPVCWNNTTYDNQCEAICAGANPAEIIEGECSSNFTCQNQLEDIFSGTIITINSESDNGQGTYTYNVTVGNTIGTTLDINLTYNCVPLCGCDSNVDIVCTNGVNYLNECLALCEGVDAADITPDWCE